MAGVTCLTGAHIIQMARQLVERLGRPLELDTDGRRSLQSHDSPTSKEEDKNLKKRYAVFNDDGSLAELKGFEQQIFKFFLEGTNLEQCYTAVAKVANQWLDVLHSKGSTLADEELMELISENRSMSKTLEEYGTEVNKYHDRSAPGGLFGRADGQGQRSKLQIYYLLPPSKCPVTERAVPVAIFSADETVREPI
ncbi:unnamed protein product, partial [Clonostachys rosea f. rosea IK726]